MAKKRSLVAIGFLGTQLDQGRGPQRWQRWRPTLSLCQQESLGIDRLELLHTGNAESLARQVSEDVAQVSPETAVVLHPRTLTDPWDFAEVYGDLHDFARAYPFRTDREDYLIHITTGTHVAQICLFLLTESRHLPGKLIQLSPPKGRDDTIGDHTIVDLDLSRHDRLAARFAQERIEGLSFLKAGIDTQSAAFNRLIERIEKVAIATTSPLLLLGPTGAGKSQLARRIFALKKSRNQVTGVFVEINCATLRGDGAMSTLFGHVKGAFTGALADRLGLLRTADGGVLFLDEIGELGLDEQAMLLRAIEEGLFFPVGADKEVHSKFQLIAGTHRDLARAVEEGRFREDLLARLDLWTFRLPALRERPEDLAPNLDFELDRASDRLGRRISISKEARATFLGFARSAEGLWPANFRDYSAAVLRMSTLAEGGRIDGAAVEEELGRLRASWAARRLGAAASPAAPARSDDDALLAPLLGERPIDPFDGVQLAEVVRVCRREPTLSAAGRALFPYSRLEKSSTNDADRLRKYLARFGLTWEMIRARV